MKARRKRSQATWVLVLVVLLAGVALAWQLTRAHARQVQQKHATSTYNPQTKASGSPSTGQSGGIVDNNSPAPSASAAPASPSATGITVSSPSLGAKVADGTMVSGTDPGAAVVNYRIKDNVAGVLATGQLNVGASGNFSGSINGLQPKGTSGFVEVYNVNSATGVESGNVKVPVTF